MRYKFFIITISLFIVLFNTFKVKAQNVGVNQPNPTNSLHVSPVNTGDDPIRIDGVQAYNVGDTSLLVIDVNTGVVKYINPSQFVGLIQGGVGTDNQNIDSLTMNGLNLTVHIENGNSGSVNLSSVSDSAISYIINNSDTLFSSPIFTDSILSIIYNNADTLLYNSTFISSLQDSIDTDVDSVVLAGTILTIYENTSSASVDLSGLNSVFIDHDWYAVGGTIAPTSINDNIYTYGNVGIGTNNPGVNLHIQNGTADSRIMLESTGAYSPYLTFRPDSGPNDQFNVGLDDADNKFKITNTGGFGTGDLVTVQQNGNVGINTTTPVAKLHVADTVSITSGYNRGYNRTIGSSIGTVREVIGAQGTSSGEPAGGFGMVVGSNQASPVVWMYEYGGRNAFQVIKKTYSGDLGTDPTLFHVDVNGNVGIGTDAPIAKLEINGPPANATTPQFAITGGYTGTVGDLYVLDSKNMQSGVGYAAKVIGVNIEPSVNANNEVQQRTTSGGITNAGAVYIGADDAQQGAFGVLTTDQGSTAGTVLTEKFTVRANGNVGVNTTTPSTNLEVNGTVKITGGNPGAGKVLTSDATGLASWQNPTTTAFEIPSGIQIYDTPGTYTWVCPAGVTFVKVVTGGGGGASGGYSGQINSGGGGGANCSGFNVVPGNSYTVVVGAGGIFQWGTGTSGGNSSFSGGCIATGGTGGSNIVAGTPGGGLISGSGTQGALLYFGEATNNRTGGSGGSGGGIGGGGNGTSGSVVIMW